MLSRYLYYPFGLLFFVVSLPAQEHEEQGEKAKPKAEVSSLKPSDIQEFDEQPAKIRELLTYALGLTEDGLGYSYGSCDPQNGGMDCSGTLHHILRHLGYEAPRQSNTIYLWVKKHGNMRDTRKADSLESPKFIHLMPGDILFWEGTYDVGERNPPTSHVMIYVGHKKSNGKPVMVGASSGRYYEGKARHGVSLFDFRLPRTGSKSKFVGYGPVPGLEPPKPKNAIKATAVEKKPPAVDGLD